MPALCGHKATRSHDEAQLGRPRGKKITRKIQRAQTVEDHHKHAAPIEGGDSQTLLVIQKKDAKK